MSFLRISYRRHLCEISLISRSLQFYTSKCETIIQHYFVTTYNMCGVSYDRLMQYLALILKICYICQIMYAMSASLVETFSLIVDNI